MASDKLQDINVAAWGADRVAAWSSRPAPQPATTPTPTEEQLAQVQAIAKGFRRRTP